MNLKKLLEKKEAKKAALAQRAAASEVVAELRSINAELSELNDEISELRSAIAEQDAAEAAKNTEARGQEAHPGDGEQRAAGSSFNPVKTYGSFAVGDSNTEAQRAKEDSEKWEQRGAYLKEGRAVTFDISELPEFRATTIASNTLVTPTQYKQTLADSPNQVSSLVDRVNSFTLLGGESYLAGFEVSHGTGGYSTEEAAYTSADTTFDRVSIGKAKITAYTEITDEAKRLPNVDYQARVAANMAKSVRRQIARQIVAGAGGSNAITGIFSAPTNVVPTATNLSIAAINSDTLDSIVYGYGGDEDVEDGAVLILSKADLAAFAAIRSTTGEKLYKIAINGNVGTISSEGSFSVPFIINSVCPALSAAGTVATTKCMSYGTLSSYELPIFSQITVEESKDFKFSTGQIAYRAAIWCGGNTTKYKGMRNILKA